MVTFALTFTYICKPLLTSSSHYSNRRRRSHKQTNMPSPTECSFNLPNFDIASQIGDGNSATVYSIRPSLSSSKCQKPQNNPKLVAKIIPYSKLTSVTRREILIHSSLSHPNIVSLNETSQAISTDGTNKNGIALIMEHATQGDLFTQLTSAGSLPSTFVRRRLCEISTALDYLHTKCNIVHLDIKLENIVLTNQSVAKLLDFGCARSLNNHSNETTTIGGTLHYLAPEIVENPDDATPTKQMDAWSLGVVFYTALSGTYPFSSDSSNEKEIRHRILNSDPNPFPSSLSIPADLTNIVFGLLEKDSSKRMTIQQVIQSLNQTNANSIASRTCSTYTNIHRRRLPYQHRLVQQQQRTRTPSPSCPSDADFTSTTENKKEDQQCKCTVCTKQTLFQMLTVLDSVMPSCNTNHANNGSLKKKQFPRIHSDLSTSFTSSDETCSNI